MIVAVGSTNPVKIQSVSLAFNHVWPNVTWDMRGCAVASGVSSQPLTDDEAIEGARNRATAAITQLGSSYGVGVEGGLQQTSGRWFAGVWVVAVDTQGKEGVGAAVKIAIPTEVMRLVEGGLELGDACDHVYKRKDSRLHEGVFGILTNGKISRMTVTRDATVSALSAFLSTFLSD